MLRHSVNADGIDTVPISAWRGVAEIGAVSRHFACSCGSWLSVEFSVLKSLWIQQCSRGVTLNKNCCRPRTVTRSGG